MIINECLRLYPPAMSVSRRAEKEVRLGSMVVPPTIMLTIPTVAVHHDTTFWGRTRVNSNQKDFQKGWGKPPKATRLRTSHSDWGLEIAWG